MVLLFCVAAKNPNHASVIIISTNCLELVLLSSVSIGGCLHLRVYYVN